MSELFTLTDEQGEPPSRWDYVVWFFAFVFLIAAFFAAGLAWVLWLWLW